MLSFMARKGIVGLSLLLAGQGAFALQFWNNTNVFSSDMPQSCQNALTYDIACENYLVTAQDAANGAALPSTLAEEYCTKECHDSIESYQKVVHLACGNENFQFYENSSIRAVPGDIANGLMWAYSLNCIKDSSGFCLGDIYNHNKSACSDCTLQYSAVMASTDFGRKNFPLAAYASLLSSCGVPESSYPVEYTSSSPTTTSGSPSGSSSATPTPTCTGKTYVSKEDDTCESISESQSISTDRLVEINHLDYACKSLVQGTKLCIEKTCHTYKVKANQTCQNIVKGQSFGMVQLIGWNPTIHQNCDNLGSMVGRSICISPLGGGDFSLPGSNKSSTSRGLTSSMFSSWTPATPTTMATDISTSWYWPTQDLNYTPVPMSYGPNSTWTSLMAERTQYCWLAGDQMNNWEFDDSEEMPSDCTSLYSSYCDLGPTDPVPKSPASSIPKTCTPETSTEEPEPSTTATPTGITTPTPTQSGMADKCNKFYKVQKDDGCQKIADDNKISVASLVSWNPDIGKECRNIKYDFYVCVGRESTSTSTSATTTGVTTPTPTQTGMVDGCDKFHKVEKDEGCQKIADDFSISVNQLKEWNPDVGKECTNLKYDFYACVGRSSSSGTSATTTTSVKSTTTANASGTPTPTQEGMVSGCKKFHKVLKDEYCAKIADESKISLNDFLSWNPDVGSNCGNLKYDFYVCIGK